MRAYRLETRSLLALAVPLILAQLAQTGLSFIDTLMAGRLGGGALAGIALGGTIFGFLLIVGLGVLFAVGPVAAQAHGAGRPQEVAAAARQGIWLAALLGVVGALLFSNAEPALRAAGQEPATAALAGAYLRAIAWGFVPALLLGALRGFLEAIGDARPIMLILVAGLGLNVLADNALMFGRWGFPALGLVGTGYASTLVYGFMAVVAGAYVHLRYRRYRIFGQLLRPEPRVLAELVRLGVPIGLTQGFEASLFAATAVLMGVFGGVALAAHQIAIQSAAVSFMMPLGVAIATSVRVGQAAGRGAPDDVRRASQVGLALATLTMVATALLYRFAPDLVIGLYLAVDAPENLEVVTLARSFLAVAALFQLFDGLQVAAAGALRGLKDTRVPMLLTLLAYWGVGIPAGVALAFGAGLAGRGLWLGLVIGLAIAGTLLLLRLRRLLRRMVHARLERPLSPEASLRS